MMEGKKERKTKNRKHERSRDDFPCWSEVSLATKTHELLSDSNGNQHQLTGRRRGGWALARSAVQRVAVTGIQRHNERKSEFGRRPNVEVVIDDGFGFVEGGEVEGWC